MMFQGGWKKMSRKICGITVDEAFYNEMMGRKFAVLDKTVNANIVEIYATSTEIAEDAPELAEAAKKVVEEIQNEIKEYYAEKEGRSSHVKMKHEDFGGYLLDLKEVFMNASKEREKLVQKKEEAYKKWEAASKSKDEYTRSKALVDYRDAEKAYREDIKELYARYKEAVNEISTNFEEHLNDFYAPNALRVDQAVVSLLNSGIVLNAKEAGSLLEQHYNNPTMLRIIGSYVTRNNLEGEVKQSVYSRAAESYGETEKRQFEGIADIIKRVTDEDELKAMSWINEKSRERFSDIVDNAAAEVNCYFIRP